GSSLPERRREEEAAVRLLAVDGIGPARMERLLARFGSATFALAAPAASVAEALRTSKDEAAHVLAAAMRCDAGRELERVGSCGGRVLLLGDPDFPALLRVAPDPPAVLFVRGALAAEPEPAVAIVGSRRATPYGRLHAARLAAELAARGVVIVSGGARGIDAEAHRGALRAGGRTIAVLAAGLEHPYPPEHAPLFDAIVEGAGAVVTEQLPGVPPRAEFFPRRNRIVAGLSLATVVVEAANRSGALVTARIAVEDLSREVGCLPGRVDSAASEGCHRAIREGWARLVTNADEIVAMMLDARTLAAGAIERMPHAPTAECNGTAVAAGRSHRTCGDGRGKASAASAVSHNSNSQEPQHEPTQISEDARTILATLCGMGSNADRASREVQRTGKRTGERTGTRLVAGLDELESTLGWSVPRLAVATLELERRGLIERDATGRFGPCESRR
ncbi:MAG: DNA-processing protein DprA, partial [bacterium]